MSKGSYLGGHTVMRDPAWPRKLASRKRKTEKAMAAKAEREARLRAEMEEFKKRKPTLIKRTPPDEGGPLS
jgi:hypothetical protein